MTPAVDGQLAGTVIIITFVVIAALLLVVLVSSTIRQQRRYLRTRVHLGGRLLTAQDEERAAIARELHDDIVQRLVATTTRLHAAEDAASLVNATDLDQVIHDLRGLARGIHPSIVEHMGLAAALAELSNAFAEREGVTVEYDGAVDPGSLSPKQRLALYRVAQEALGNVARHADTDRAWVRLVCEPQETVLVIEDRGRGFERRTADSGPGIGVTSMRERLALLGGTLDVESAPGSGTRITATVPHAGASS